MDDDIFVSSMAKFYAIYNFSGYIESLPGKNESIFYEHKLQKYGEEEITDFIKICCAQNPAVHELEANLLKTLAYQNLSPKIWRKVEKVPILFYYEESLCIGFAKHNDRSAIMIEWKLFSKIEYLFHLFQQTSNHYIEIVFSKELTHYYKKAFEDLSVWSSMKTIFPPPDLISFLPLGSPLDSMARKLTTIAKTYWLLCEYGHLLLNDYYDTKSEGKIIASQSPSYIFSTDGEITADIFAIQAMCDINNTDFEEIILTVGILLRFIDLRVGKNKNELKENHSLHNSKLQRWERIKIFASSIRSVSESVKKIDGIFDFLQTNSTEAPY